MVDSLSLEWYDRREHVLHFAIREPVEHTLRAGDPVVLYPYHGQWDDVLHNRVVKGTLRAVENDLLEFVPGGRVRSWSISAAKTVGWPSTT